MKIIRHHDNSGMILRIISKWSYKIKRVDSFLPVLFFIILIFLGILATVIAINISK